MNRKSLTILVLALFSLLTLVSRVPAQTVTKLTDLAVGQFNGVGYGPSNPEGRFTVIGTNLWFVGNMGGAAGAGGVFIFDPFTTNVTQVATFDNNSGKTPWASSITVANGVGWFTTSLGGTGNKGSLCSIDLNTYLLTNVFNFPTNPYSGWSPHSTPVQIGNDLWFTTSSGGVAPDSNTIYGAIVKYNLNTGVLTNVFTLDSINTGRQPLGNSLVQASNAWYYLTFAGGTNTVGGTPNGAGVLGKITFGDDGQPNLTNVLDLPGRFLSFPAGDPVYDGTNFLYFTTVGVTSNSGAIARFDLTQNTLTTLFTFVTNAVATTNFGKQPYGTPVFYNNELYFTTFAGGTLGKGVLDKLSLSNNVVTKLVDFDGATGLALGGSSQYGGGTIFTNPANGHVSLYFPMKQGGINNVGTIIRVSKPPIVASLAQVDGMWQLSWTSGNPPFTVDANFTSLTDAWTINWLGALNTNVVTFTTTNDSAFFRVEGAPE